MHYTPLYLRPSYPYVYPVNPKAKLTLNHNHKWQYNEMALYQVPKKKALYDWENNKKSNAPHERHCS